MKILTLFLLITTSGCTMISNDRVFPKLTWYWTSEAKRQRESNKQHDAEMKAYKESQQQKAQ